MLLVKSVVLSVILFLGLAIFTKTAAYADTEQLTPFEAEYLVYRFGRSLGHAKLSLQTEQSEQYRLDYYSKVSAFFLSDIRSETSLFSYSDGKMQPKTYAYSRSGTGSDKSNKIQFDAKNEQIIINQDFYSLLITPHAYFIICSIFSSRSFNHRPYYTLIRFYPIRSGLKFCTIPPSKPYSTLSFMIFTAYF